MQYTTLAGSGCTLGATEIVLTSFKGIEGTNLTMASFGTKGFMTLEPSNSTQEEQISFSGITQNANGTATLTGVKNVLFITPFTETSGTSKSHPGGSKAVVSNTSGFYNSFANKLNTETVVGLWTFPSSESNRPRIDSDVDTAVATALVTLGQLSRQAIAGASNASTTVKGIVQLPTQSQIDNRTTTGSTAALLSVTPDKLRATKYVDYVADTGTATAFAIAPTPTVTIYTAGLEFKFKASHTSGTAPTLNVNGTGAKALTFGKIAAGANSIRTNSIVGVVYDGTNMQITSVSKPALSQESAEIYGTSTGVGTAYAVGLVPALTAYTPGLVVNFKPDTASSGGATINVNGLGAKTIVTQNGATVSKNDILANRVTQLGYDGTNMQLLSSGTGSRLLKINPAVTINASTANIVSMYVPGAVMTANGYIDVVLQYQCASAGATARTQAYALKYGGTTLGTVTLTYPAIGGGSGVGSSGTLRARIFNSAATGSQLGVMNMTHGYDVSIATNQVSAYPSGVASGTSSIDSTARQALIITGTPSGSGYDTTFFTGSIEAHN